MINILITSAGRRVELVQRFMIEKQKLNVEGNIVCADMNNLAPALYFSDKYYTIPAIGSENYLSALADICKKEQITLLIPTIDTELELLSLNAEKFQEMGTIILISSTEVISATHNKINTYRMFKEAGVKTPESYWKGKEYSGGFPCYIKPVAGSSSINAFRVNNEKELEFFKYYIKDYIIQELIEGEEYTIDVLCDFSGNPIYITPRLRIATRSGEVLKTRIENNKVLIDKVKLILEYLKPAGPITVQAIRCHRDNQFYFIEVNARFGGGSPLSMMAGANSVEAIYRLIKGERLEYIADAAQDGLVLVRFDQSIMLDSLQGGGYERIKSGNF